MFPPLLCFLLLGLLLRFPFGKFTLPFLALEKGLNFREQDMGKGFCRMVRDMLSARRGRGRAAAALLQQLQKAGKRIGDADGDGNGGGGRHGGQLHFFLISTGYAGYCPFFWTDTGGNGTFFRKRGGGLRHHLCGAK